MKTRNFKIQEQPFKKIPLVIALGALLAGSGVINQFSTDSFELIPTAQAAQGQGGQGNAGQGGGGRGGGGQGGGQGGGGQGSGGQGGGGQGSGAGGGGSSSIDNVLRGKKSVILEADEDSDRPDWAGGDKELNPHSGTGNPNPGDMKGDSYGDLWIIARVPDTGEPDLNDDGHVQPIAFYDSNPDPEVTELVMYTNPDGTPVLLELNEEGEVVAGQTTATGEPLVTSEVEFGRANLVRSPDKVTEHALDEAVSKIEDGTEVTLDPIDGRLVVDGVKIDSPLENLAVYIALVDESLSAEVLAKLPDTSLDLAAALLAGGSDKTRDVVYVDYVAYLNNIMGLTPDLSAYVYDRSDYTDMNVDYLYFTDETMTATDTATVNIADYLSWINGDITDNTAIEGFTSSVDDSIELIEFVHTAVHPYELTEANVTP